MDKTNINNMKIENGKKVTVSYTGKLETGEVFDSNVGAAPLVFTFGVGELIEGFENGLQGLSVGDKSDILVTPENGYGQHHQELIQQVGLDILPQGVQAGNQLEGTSPQGERFIATVVSVNESEKTAMLDRNHPLAGKNLIFSVEVLNVEDSTLISESIPTIDLDNLEGI